MNPKTPLELPIRSETAISIGALKVMFGILLAMLMTASSVATWALSQMRTEFKAGIDTVASSSDKAANAAEANTEAITDLRVTMEGVTTQLGEIRRATDREVTQWNSKFDRLEERVRAMENGK